MWTVLKAPHPSHSLHSANQLLSSTSPNIWVRSVYRGRTNTTGQRWQSNAHHLPPTWWCFPALVYRLWWRGDAHPPEEVPVLNNLQLSLYSGRHRRARAGVCAALLLPRRWAQTLEHHQQVRAGREQAATWNVAFSRKWSQPLNCFSVYLPFPYPSVVQTSCFIWVGSRKPAFCTVEPHLKGFYSQ